MKTLRPIMLAGLMVATLGSACLVVEHEHPGCLGDECYLTPGDMRFYWAFELADGSSSDWCEVAEVAWVDIYIYDYAGNLEFEALNRPCADSGAIIDNFYPGIYDLNLVGICPQGVITHEGWWSVRLDSGINELGVLTLDYLAPCR